MPAAAVIPAPVAYIKFVAVKKLVVGFEPQGFSRVAYRFVCEIRLVVFVALEFIPFGY